MKKLCLSTLTLFAFVFGLTSPALQAQSQDELLYSWGKVVSVSSSSITLLEYDYDTDQEQQNSYVINAQTQLFQVESVANIAEGDAVEVEYYPEGNSFIAYSLNVEKEALQDSSSDEESYY